MLSDKLTVKDHHQVRFWCVSDFPIAPESEIEELARFNCAKQKREKIRGWWHWQRFWNAEKTRWESAHTKNISSLHLEFLWQPGKNQKKKVVFPESREGGTVVLTKGSEVRTVPPERSEGKTFFWGFFPGSQKFFRWRGTFSLKGR